MTSREWSVVVVALASFSLRADCGEQGEKVYGSGETPMVNQVPDSLRIAHYLKSEKLSLVRIGDHQDGYYAAIARTDGPGASLVLIPLSVRSDSVISMEPRIPLGEYAPNLVHWLNLGGSGVDGLLITFDQRSEGIIGTAVYSLTDLKLRLSYRDGKDVCSPAELRDLDGDGRPELVSYTEDPSRGDCTSDCHVELVQRFQIQPAWVRVWKWTRDEWTPAEHDFPQFYHDLAQRYNQVDRLITHGVEYDVCRTAHWLKDLQVFRKWASRAQHLAAGH